MFQAKPTAIVANQTVWLASGRVIFRSILGLPMVNRMTGYCGLVARQSFLWYFFNSHHDAIPTNFKLSAPLPPSQ